MTRFRRLWWITVLAAVLALVFELATWFVPLLLKAIREPACAVQFCLVLGTDTETACVTVSFLTVQYQHSPGGIAQLYLWPGRLPQQQGTLSQRQAYTRQYQVGYEYPCYYRGNMTGATFTPPRTSTGLYLSFLVAMSLLAVSVFAIYMALRLPPQKGLSVPQAVPTVFPAAQSVPNQSVANSTAEALKQADANLNKRIIRLATKLENERDARMELELRVSQSLEASAFRRTSRTNAVSPLGRQTEAV